VRLCRDRSFFRVAIQEEWGRPTGLLQSLWGTAVRILLASADSSILVRCPNSMSLLFCMIEGHINEFTVCWPGLGLRWVTIHILHNLNLCRYLRSSQLSLAIPLWDGKMSAGDGYCHRYWRKSEFCVTLGSFARPLPSQSRVLNGASHVVC